MKDQLYVSLDLLGSLPQPVVLSVGEQIIAGLVTLVKTHRDVITYVRCQYSNNTDIYNDQI